MCLPGCSVVLDRVYMVLKSFPFLPTLIKLRLREMTVFAAKTEVMEVNQCSVG